MPYLNYPYKHFSIIKLIFSFLCEQAVVCIMKPSICEEKNFNFLFKSHYEAIRNYMYYKCGNMDQAEDLVQNAFTELWKRCANVLFEKAKSYLYRACTNAFLNEVAHKKVVLRFQSSNSKSDLNIQSPDYLLEEQEFKQRLEEAISNLPVKEREVFLLSRIDKKKYSEIAEIVGISVKGVEQRMSKALIKLRSALGTSLKF